MSFITLVRHGQANSTAKDEESYDRLSDLGWQQARWLGAYFHDAGDRFAHAWSGTLRRQIETAQAAGFPDAQRDERLNEIAYFTLANLLEAQHGIAMPNDHESYITHIPVLLRYWQEGRIEDAPESFAEFEKRTSDVLQELAAGKGRALVVTSAVVIGMAMRVVMRLDINALAHASLIIENSSLHRIQPLSTGLAFSQFNAIPHMDSPERQNSRSHV